MSDHSGTEEALAEIVEAVLDRLRKGEYPTIEEYAARHPRLAAHLRDLLPALIAVERDLSVEGESALPIPRGDMPDRLGDYRILREIGRGGMGVVYEAVQQSLGRHVALKVLPWATIGPNSVERFRREARAAARLHHTNIVPVFDVGADHNTHFFAMQYIRGQGLDQVVSELRVMRSLPPSQGPLSIASRLREGRFDNPEESVDLAGLGSGTSSKPKSSRASRPSRSGSGASEEWTEDGSPRSFLSGTDSVRSSQGAYYDAVARIVLQVAEALSYAHHHGILHRDVKPANILLDTRGTAWVTDFGLAKSNEELGPTRTGDVLGTLRYMAPERYDGVSDPRSDIYGLGATFYELLTLQPLFQDAPRPQLIDAIRRREPVAPRKLDARIPRDLEVICLKCLAKEPTRRYETAERLAHDLQRYLGGQTITARSTGSLERSYRWCRRNPTLTGMLAALAATFTLGLAGTTYEWQEARGQRDEARIAAKRATDEATRADAASARATAARVDAQRLAARTALTQGRSLADQGAVAQGMLWMAAALRETPPEDRELDRLIRLNLSAYDDSLIKTTRFLPDEPESATAQLSLGRGVLATTRAVDPDKRRYEGGFWDCATRQRIGDVVPGAFRIWLSPDGKVAAAHRENDVLDFLEVRTGKRISAAKVGEIQSLQGVTFSPDGKLVAEFGGLREERGTPGLLRFRDVATGAVIGRPLRFESSVHFAQFRPDGGAIAVSCLGAEVSLWRLDSSLPPLFRDRFDSYGYSPPITFDPSGRHLIFGWFRRGIGEVRFLDANSGRPVERRIPMGNQSAIGFSHSADGRLLLTSESGQVLRLWDAATDEPVAFLPVRLADRSTTNFLASSDALLVLPENWYPNAVRRLELPEALELAAPPPADVATRGPLIADLKEKSHGSAVYDAVGDRMIVSGLSAARVIDLESGLPIGEPIRNFHQNTGPVAVSRDGTIVAAVSNNLGDRKPQSTDCVVEICSTQTGRRRCPPLHPTNSVVAIDFSPDGRVIATGDFSDELQLWDTTNGLPIGPPLPQENIVSVIAFSPDGKRLAVGTHTTRRQGHAGVSIWDLEHRRIVGPPARHRTGGAPAYLIWSRDGSAVVSLDRDSSDLMRVDAGTGTVTARASDFTGRPTLMIASPDGRSLLTGTEEGRLELRDSVSLERTGPAMSAFDPARIKRGVNTLAFAPDGRTAAAGYLDGTVRLWDLASRSPIGLPRGFARSPLALIFRHEGHTLSLITQEGEVRSINIRKPITGPLDLIEARLEADTGLRIGTNQDFVALSAKELADRSMLIGRSDQESEEGSGKESEDFRHERAARFTEYQFLWEPALFHLDHLLVRRPNDGLLRVRRALALAGVNRLSEADAEVSRAIKFGPSDACLDLLIHRALDARDTGKLDLAEWAFCRAIAERPENWRLYVDRSVVRSLRGDMAGRDRDIDLAASKRADADYLAQVAEESRAAGQSQRCAFLLDLAATRLDESTNPFTLRAISARMAVRGRLALAADLTARVDTFRHKNSLQSIYRRALVHVAHHDREAYRLLCRELTAKPLGNVSPATLNLVAWICSLGPDAEDSADRVVELATAALERGKASERAVHLNTLGAALIRAGRPEEGIRRIEEGIRHRSGTSLPQDRALLAIAHRALGHREEAVRLLSSGEPTNGVGEDLVEALLLHREAVSAVFDRGFPSNPFTR